MEQQAAESDTLLNESTPEVAEVAEGEYFNRRCKRNR